VIAACAPAEIEQELYTADWQSLRQHETPQ
jgi:hypothetical protein